MQCIGINQHGECQSVNSSTASHQPCDHTFTLPRPQFTPVYQKDIGLTGKMLSCYSCYEIVTCVKKKKKEVTL